MDPDPSEPQDNEDGRPSQEVDADLPLNEHESDENTPLLSRQDGTDEEVADGAATSPRSSAASSLLRSIRDQSPNKGSKLRRWPSILALSILCIAGVVILIAGFFAPEVAEEYASQAAKFEPQRLSIDSFTDTGVVARVQGDIVIDASRVTRKPIRDLGRFGTWIAKEAESGKTLVEISLPEYGDLLLGTAAVPAIKVNLRDGHSTAIDFLTIVEPGEKEVLRRIAHDWMDGKLGQIRVKGEADVPIKSGLLSLGEQSLSQDLVLEGKL